MKQKLKILIFCTILVAKGAFGQKLRTDSTTYFSKKLSFTPYYTRLMPVTIPANFYTTNMGFVCKQELKLEHTTRLPLRFRLGSLGYNNWLEGKKNAGILPLP